MEPRKKAKMLNDVSEVEGNDDDDGTTVHWKSVGINISLTNRRTG